ncbi:BrnT family toxin [uncultured Rhodospira sp.]|uniref:BrnT family toxin n=1 Tax=uncultured Rhodospira sp. TaxID=1936189 RepID=UPI002604D831|nr:BrnT family toxin [uncultured Rhodospira sp.]
MIETDWLGFEWDERKETANIERRGLPFTEGAAVFQGFVQIRRDDRHDYGEDRFLAIGEAKGRILTVVFTIRPEGICRIISVRQARKDERAHYQEELGRHQAASGNP